MLRVDFHCHTIFSEDSLTQPEALIEACRRKGVDRVIITDHNTIQGALIAQQLDPQRVIVGEEILTTVGELLAAFVLEEIPPGLEPQEAIRRLRQQGAFISVSHPFDRLRTPWPAEMLAELAPQIDAIETFNARCIWPGFNRQAQAFALQHHLPGTSGSDAHTPGEVGAATLLLENFTNPAELRQVIQQAQARNQRSSLFVHFASRKAVRVKREMSAKSDLKSTRSGP